MELENRDNIRVVMSTILVNLDHNETVCVWDLKQSSLRKTDITFDFLKGYFVLKVNLN